VLVKYHSAKTGSDQTMAGYFVNGKNKRMKKIKMPADTI
jgi:hypothetical protein